MKTTKQIWIGLMGLSLTIHVACGDIKVKGDIDDHDVDAIVDALGGDEEDSTAEESAPVEDQSVSQEQPPAEPEEAPDPVAESADNSISDTNADKVEDDPNNIDVTMDYMNNNSSSPSSTSVSAGVSYGDPDDPSGGISYFPETKKGQSRGFRGTYEIDNSYTTCNDYWNADLDVPAVLRAYSYGDKIDFETSLSELVWGAQIYPDSTFDFRIYYLDSWGNSSVTLTCTCGFYESWWSSDEETMECACDPSNYDGSCNLYYKSM